MTFSLRQWLTTGNRDMFGAMFLHLGNDIALLHPTAAMKRVGSIAITASHGATSKAHKDRWIAHSLGLTLNGKENFGNS